MTADSAIIAYADIFQKIRDDILAIPVKSMNYLTELTHVANAAICRTMGINADIPVN